ncbi:MAG: response regulator [Planctomycetes bacterium]|nr:response regulator [Planctomycetota bacterium]
MASRVPTEIRVLLAEGDPAAVQEIRARLSESGECSIVLSVAGTMADAMHRVTAGGVDAILLSLDLPDSHGPASVAALRDRAPLAPILIVVSPEDSALSAEFLRAGAQDYVVRGTINPTFLSRRLRSAIERKRIDEEARLLTVLSLAVSQAQDLDGALKLALRDICAFTGWDIGQAWIPAEGEERLDAGPVWMRDSSLQVFRAASERAETKYGIGLLWGAFLNRRPILCLDLAAEPTFRRIAAATEAGLRGGLFIPVLAGNDVVAVIEFLMCAPRPEDESLVRLIAAVAAQLGQAFLRRKMEGELHESEEHFRKIVDSLYNGYLIQEDGVIREITAGIAGLFGYTPAELVGREITEIVVPEEREMVKEKYRSGHAGAYEIVGLRKDGTRFHAEVLGFNHRWKGRPARLGAVRDISDRRNAADRLARLNDCFLSFGPDPTGNIDRLVAFCGETMSAAWALFATCDAEGRLSPAAQWQVPPAHVSPGSPLLAFCHQVLGSARTDVVLGGGRPVLRHGDTNPNILKGPQMTLAGRVVWCGGVPRGALCIGLPGEADPSREDARLMGIIASAIGVEEERRQAQRQLQDLEENLRQSTKMEAIGRLAGGVAHDFNNLLTAIIGYAELARDRFAEGDPLRKEMDEILKAGDRASSLTRQLLAFGRKQVLQPQVIEVNAIVADTEKLLRRLIGENIQLEMTLAPDAGRVRADRGQIEQVLINLAVNARDAMPAGGRLSLRTARVAAVAVASAPGTPPPDAACVRFSIADTGVGMSPEVLAHIFEPFFTTKERGRGTGLGLATVYGIVRQSGGRISVNSVPGEGTTFDIDMPCVEEAGLERRTEAPRPAPTGPETILVVEDEEPLRVLMVRALRGLGYTVLEAGDGAIAASVSAAHPAEIHLLITDVVMPGLSGPKVAEQLSRSRPGMRVLFISGYTDDALGRHGLIDTDVEFLPKPFTPRTLAERVRHVLEKRGQA